MRVRYKREEYLLYIRKKISLETGQHYDNLKFRPEFTNFSTFQISRKLFVCGGGVFKGMIFTELTDLLSVDYDGRSLVLSPMQI